MRLRTGPRLAAALLSCILAISEARADERAKPSSAAPAQRPQKLLSPDARRFHAPSSFAYWAGTERVLDGELSPAMPRPLEGVGLLPELDDHLSTTAYLRVARSGV